MEAIYSQTERKLQACIMVLELGKLLNLKPHGLSSSLVCRRKRDTEDVY